MCACKEAYIEFVYERIYLALVASKVFRCCLAAAQTLDCLHPVDDKAMLLYRKSKMSILAKRRVCTECDRVNHQLGSGMLEGSC